VEGNRVSPIEHFLVNRVQVVGTRCSACGGEFASDLAGEPVLSVAVGPEVRIHVFCGACGNSILVHVLSDEARHRYTWDWMVPLRGAIAESSLEQEARRLEESAADAERGPFRAFGQAYPSERAAIISFLGKVCAGEANGADAFAAWAAVCATASIKSGVRMIAEREACHARILEQRLHELGGEKAVASQDRRPLEEEGRQFKEDLGNPQIPDDEKLLRLYRSLGDPKDAIKPICHFAALIEQDVETKDALLLLAEDELSTATWVEKTCRALCASAGETREA
jgi:hypothetical protein